MNIYTMLGMLFAGLAMGLFIAGARSTKPNLSLLPNTDTTMINQIANQTKNTKFDSVTPLELFSKPEKYLNKDIELVDYMPTDSNWYSPPEFRSGVWLKVPGVPGTIEHLNQGFQKVKIQGKFIEPGENAGSKYAIEVQDIRVLPMDKNYQDVSKAEMDELIKNPGTKDRQWIRYEGTWESGFEMSLIDENIWLTNGLITDQKTIEEIQKRLRNNRTLKVRVTGLLYNSTQNYGHMGLGKVEILSDSLEILE